MKKIKVLLCEDHTIVREGVRLMLESEFEIAGSVEDGRALVAAAIKVQPDVIISDISMPLLNGIEALRQLKKAGVTSKVIFLTMHPDADYATEAFRAGASGYVLKNSAGSELLTAIREAVKGRVYVTPLIAKDMLNTLMQAPEPAQAKPVELTARQREVLQLVAEGHSAKEIADILHVSPRTVEFHKYRLMELLGVHTTAELTQYAVKRGISSLP